MKEKTGQHVSQAMFPIAEGAQCLLKAFCMMFFGARKIFQTTEEDKE